MPRPPNNMVTVIEALIIKYSGLVSRVYETSQLVDEAVKMAAKIASFSQPIGNKISIAKKADIM